MKYVSLSLIGLVSALLAAPAWSEPCPASPDHSVDMMTLIEQVQSARNESAARVISNQMWSLWADAPNEQSQAMLDRGMTRRSSYDFIGALSDFDALVEYCPNYAEGYNQRAFVNYLRQDFTASLADLARAIALSPSHIAALSGRALSLMGLSRLEEARAAMALALELNPWLPERGLAAKGGPLAQPGEDI
jgi:tetratricopeptide (TPR) repeat protein